MARTKGPDEVFCRSCGERIKRAAEICPECGVRNHEASSVASGASSPATSSGSTRSRDPAEYETTVSDSWYVAIVAGVGLSVVGLAAISGDPAGPLYDVGGFAFIGGWFLLPVGTYYDSKYVRANSRWDPSTGAWVLLALLWFVNVVAGVVYLYRRHEVLGVP
jgi:hypothetical protein